MELAFFKIRFFFQKFSTFEPHKILIFPNFLLKVYLLNSVPLKEKSILLISAFLAMSKETLECRVIFHDPSHLQFKKTKNGHVFRTGQYQPLFLRMDKNILRFYAERHSEEDVCSVSTQRMNVEVDKNAK